MTRRPKRTYKAVTVAPSGAGYAVLLDSKPAKAGAAILTLPTAALADAVAEEWRGQGERVDTECMRLTAIAGGALNRVATARGDVIEHVLGYGRTELVCYRAAAPPELAARQCAQWDALLEWIHTRHHVRLIADSGITFIEQPVDALVRMQEIVSDLGNFELAALDYAAALTSSFVVALALIERHVSADAAFAVSHLDELYQTEKWGQDAEAQSRSDRILADLRAIDQFISLLKK